MSEFAITAKNLCKTYMIVHKKYDEQQTLAGTVGHELKGRLRNAVLHLSGKSAHVKPVTTREAFEALRDVSFDVRPGERIGIIGRNGAGKSTLLKILARITRPTSGQALIQGRVSSLLEVGTGFHPELTGRENIYLNASVLGMPRSEIKKHFDEIVAFSEVEKFLDTPVKRYSSGMTVRLAFSVAAHLEPDVLLLDEVLSVGDAKFQKKCLNKMRSVAGEGRTVVFVSHNLFSVLNLCERSILLTNGRMEMDGKSPDVFKCYIASGGADTGGGQVIWPDIDQAPGNSNVRLAEVSICGEDGIHSGVLSMFESLTLKVRFHNFKKGARYMVNVNIKDQYGTWVLTALNVPSASTEPDPLYGKPLDKGIYETSCILPGNIFNNIVFNVYVAIIDLEQSDIAPVQEEDALTFVLNDPRTPASDYKGPYHGPLRMLLSWKTRPVED